MTIFQKSGRILDIILVGFAWFAGSLMIFSLVSVCIDVVMRYFFNSPSGWILQISEYILLYIPFNCRLCSQRRRTHQSRYHSQYD